ncbi:hypothetical protein Unana1_02137 [Umbelopsis nana]
MAQISATVRDKHNLGHYIAIEDTNFIDKSDGTDVVDGIDTVIAIQDIFAITEDGTSFSVHYASYPKPTDPTEAESKSLRPKAIARELYVNTYVAEEGKQDSVQEFFNELRKRLDVQPVPHNTRIHAILNPAAGGRQSKDHWKNIILPMLATSGVAADQIQLHETKRVSGGKTLAQDLATNVFAQSQDRIILLCIGGDGTLHEVINGLSQAAAQPKLQLGLVPSGSGNAFANALGITDPADAILRLLRGKLHPLRTVRVSFGRSSEPYSSPNWHQHVEYDAVDHDPRIMVVFSWGFHTQIVSKSDYLRPFMGNSRFSVVAGFLLWWMPQYTGKLMLDAGAQQYKAETKTWYTETDQKSIDGQYTYFLGAKMPELEPGFRIAPFASTSDEYVDLVLLRDGTRDDLKSLLYKSFQKGAHVNEPKVEYWKTNGLLLRVQDAAEVCLDGEIHKVSKGGVIRLQVVQPSAQGEVSIEVFM